MNDIEAYQEMVSLSHRLRSLAESVVRSPGGQIIIQAIRSADGSSVSIRAQVTIPGKADPYMYLIRNDGSEDTIWKGWHILPEQVRFGSVPYGCDSDVWIQMQEKHRRGKRTR